MLLRRTGQQFAHPPWCLITRALMKAQAEVILIMGIATMVSSSDKHVDRLPDPATRPDSTITQLQLPPLLSTTATEGLWKRFKEQLVPEEAINLILSS